MDEDANGSSQCINGLWGNYVIPETGVEHQNIRDCGSEDIMDDIVLFKILLAIIIQYFEVVI